MRNTTYTLIFSTILITMGLQSRAQGYYFPDFVGTWHGTISSQQFGGYNDPMTMVIEPDGFYTETSGHLMPTIYPNTQQCEFEEETNRMHFWYLDVVYAGQYFYQHFFYEVVYFNNDTLEMHYNFWDDPEPHPEVQTIFLVRETSVGIGDEPANENREMVVLRVTDLMGREVPANTRGQMLIFQYSDGTSEKKFIREK